MQLSFIPSLINQFRETFEGMVTDGMCWIVDARRDGGMLGAVQDLSADDAFAVPVPGAKPIAAHVGHVRFALDLTLARLRGQNPRADWLASFDIPAASVETWDWLRKELRGAYENVFTFLDQRRHLPLRLWPAVSVLCLSALTAHNSYHLGAIRQIDQVIRHRCT